MADAGSTGYLVTGASGFVAMHLIELLLSRGHCVRGTLRRMDRAAAVKQALLQRTEAGSRLELIPADLNHEAGWAEAARGMAGIFHVASPVPGKTPLRDEYFVGPATRGTLHVLQAARSAGVGRVVVTSSTAAITGGLPCRDTPFTEEDWGNLEHSEPYEKSKIAAERAAWDWVRTENDSPELAAVNPSFVLGPVLWKERSPSLDIVALLLNSRFPGVPDLHFGLVDVRDVAEAHYLAMTRREAAGQRFLCNTVVWSHRDIARFLHGYLGPRGIRIPTGKIPGWVIKLGGLVSPSMRFIAPKLGARCEFDATRLRNLLGWKPRDITTTLRDTADSLLA